MTTRPPIPASFFGMPVGILGLAGAWNVGARIWHLPSIVGSVLEIVGASIWLVLVILYGAVPAGGRPELRRGQLAVRLVVQGRLLPPPAVSAESPS